jgi:influenza virus NS1A-binding protein
MVGGFDGKQSLCSTEIYDPDTNSWSPGPSMTTCRANVGVAVVDGKLYAVGGFSGKVHS